MLRVERFFGMIGIALSVACITPIGPAEAQTAASPQATQAMQGTPIWQMVPAPEEPNSMSQNVWLYNTQTGQVYECTDTTAGARCFPALMMPQTQNPN